MYAGYLAMGNPEGIDEPFREIINNSRAYAYAAQAGICWLEECLDCPETSVILPGGPNYFSPKTDLAPWYDPENPDTAGFLGVVGLEVVGDENSTMTASVTNTIRPGGVIGPAFYGARTMVIRCMAIASDECSLQAGLDWLRAQVTVPMDPCGGDKITFFDCCPCVCDAGEPTGDACWATTMDELDNGPACATWWPSTYDEFLTGPPAEDETWCDWIDNMNELDIGPNTWSCCADECVRPYVRQFRNCRFIEGPTMLQKPQMYSVGALAVLEMTLVAADPAEFSLDSRAFREVLTPATVVPVPPAPPAPPTWPFPDHVSTVPGSSTPAWFIDVPETNWVRTFSSTYAKAMGNLLYADRATIIIQSGATPALETRIGLWDGDEFIVGYYLPSVPANVIITIDGVSRTITGKIGDFEAPLHDFVRSWDGGIPILDDVPHSVDRLSVDQRPAPGVALTVELRLTGVTRP